MKKITLSAIAVLTLLPNVLSADGFNLFSDAKFNGEIRPRYESVDDQSNTKDKANAFTVRTTIGVEANLLSINGLSMKVDGTTVQPIGGEHYDSGSNGLMYDKVVDPEQTRFSQAYLQYKYGKTVAKVGRQVINLDNQRFIGSVDWRQMMQSFDAAVISDSTIDNLTLTGAYVWGRAPVSDLGTSDTDSIILNGSYKVSDMLKVTAYDYIISSASDTIGMALTGDVPLASAKIAYRAEYASQGDASRDTDSAHANVKADAYYYNLDALANINGILAGAGYEFLSGHTTGDGKTSFFAPLGTLHAFNGWADKFLGATPTGGLTDMSATLGYTAPGLGKAMVVYHDFSTDVSMGGKSDLGTEWDALYTNAIPGIKGLNGLAKAAFFKAGDVTGYTADVSKIWLQIDYKF
ncbi:alginate export family protein [Sulfuricurvum sp.]|uniref:alginate export family protein n=1 Tax=Sulfuricurvum sp. TaxID=2025608 RepID=UPI0026019CFA|nr:alginate export family protein [Sulfuricurvum sp.]MDD4950324.1 alginate export family protein [Sulfuricurvum sp.]